MKFRLLSVVAAILSITACSGDSKNAAPIVFTKAVEVRFEQSTELQIVATDVDNDPLSYQVVQASSKGLLVMQNGSGKFSYQPDDLQTEPQQVRIQVSDGQNIVEQEIELNITDTRTFVVESTLPTANALHVSASEDIEITFNSLLSQLPPVNQDCSAALGLYDEHDNCVGIEVSFGNNNKSLLISPVSQLTSNSQYRLKLTQDLQNFVGNNLDSELEFSYRTAQQNLVISEVMLDASEFKQRWVEIYNGTSQAINLSDHAIRTSAIDEFGVVSQGHVFTLPKININPGEHLVLQNDTFYYDWQTGFVDGPGIVMIADADKRMFWNTSGQIELIQAAEVVDAVYFGNADVSNTGKDNWQGEPVTTDHDSTFITRAKYANDADTASDWQTSAFPTAGSYNDVECQLDTDEDGIPDCSEQIGKTYAGIDLYDLGARAEQKDIFVEIDHMKSEDLGVVPQLEAIEKVVQAFDSTGFKLHIDVGDLFDLDNTQSRFNLAGGQQVPFVNTIHFSESPVRASIFQYKHKYFDVRRRNAFHYMLFANSQLDSGSAGSSGYAEINGNDSLITLGGWGLSRANEASINYLINMQSSVIMHELGHNFGLYHGGEDSVNHKPNHLSVMNYMYQLQGLPTIGNDEGDRMLWRAHPFNENCTSFDYVNGPEQDYRLFNINYSHGHSLPFDETNLIEALGFGHQGSNPIDYNCSGTIEQSSVTLDYNGNDWLGDVFFDYNEWAGLQLNFNRDSASATFTLSSRNELQEIAPSTELLERIHRAKGN